MRNIRQIFLVLSIIVAGLSGCGQKGPLYEKAPSEENKPAEQQ
ncbi:LPS translocon maturation chaperone LptM [Thalassotalea aquiviva]